jgi:hypothetical protein
MEGSMATEKVLPPWFDDIDEIIGDAFRHGDEEHKKLPRRFAEGDGIHEVIDDKHLDLDPPDAAPDEP